MSSSGSDEAQSGAADSRWYLVQCKPRQDMRAEEHLERQGYRCLRPLIVRERLVGGRALLVDEPLFPGYLFIRLSDSDNWAPLRSTRGVGRIVSFGGKPLPVSDAVVAAIQRRCQDIPSQVLLAPGDKVRIDAGGMAELEAIFLAMDDGQERAVLLIQLMQREHRVSMPLASIRPIAE